MSSAVRWRVSLLWKRSSTFSRGTVTFRPLLLSSRGSLMAEIIQWFAIMRGSTFRGFPMRFIAVFLLAFTVAACVLRIDIQQANTVAQDLVDRLKPAMT